MIQAVIFDMDGLMFDTERLAKKGWENAAKHLHFSICSEQIGQIRGRTKASARQLFKEWYKKEDLYDKAYAIRTAYVEQSIREQSVPVKKGLIKLLTYLKEHQYKTAVATSTGREIAEWYWELAKVQFFFTETVCGNEVKNGKPDPEIFLKVAEKLCVKPENCLVLEDSFHGIRAAKAAGMKRIMVPDLDAPTEEAKESCMAIVEALDDIIVILKKEREA